MCIRKGIPDDIDALVALDHVTRLDSGRADYITDALHKGNAFVAERDEIVVGYGVLTYHFYGNGMMELIYVARNYRRSGVGRALVGYAESYCKTPKLFTSTNLTNRPMQLLLEGLGYRLSGYIDNLDPGDPELVYFKHLEGKTR
jgi:ribosomal protein S18 acetylase RimI-like enzyme